MPERQKHGFDFQKQFIENNSLKEEECYTGEWDAYTKNGYPIQIKTYKKSGEIDLGDLKRNVNKKENFLLVLAPYVIANGIKKFCSTKIFDVKADDWKGLFNCGCLNEMYDFLSNISNDKKDDQAWKQGVKEFKEKAEGLAVPRFKRDHKKQKRIQAAIPKKNIESVISKFAEVDVACLNNF